MFSSAFTFYRNNASGVLLGSQRIRGDLDLDRGGKTFATRSVIEVLDLNDAVIGGGCATAAGTRFEYRNMAPGCSVHSADLQVGQGGSVWASRVSKRFV